jgi:hypothetical protein
LNIKCILKSVLCYTSIIIILPIFHTYTIRFFNTKSINILLPNSSINDEPFFKFILELATNGLINPFISLLTAIPHNTQTTYSIVRIYLYLINLIIIISLLTDYVIYYLYILIELQPTFILLLYLNLIVFY